MGDIHVKASLVLSGAPLFTSERQVDMYSAYQQCVDQLVRKIKTYIRHLESGGSDPAFLPTVIADHEEITAAIEKGDFASFRRALLIYEEPLRKRVGRWIQRYSEVQSSIGLGMEIADIVEDTILTAFEQFEGRPADVPAGDWLETLMDQVIHEIIAHPDREIENLSMIRSELDAEYQSEKVSNQ